MKFELLIKEGAQADITEGFRQYSKISSKLGDDFLQKLDDAFEQILSGPEMFATNQIINQEWDRPVSCGK